MEDWKNTKCGTCIIQRQKPICNSCMGHQFYKPMSNADKIQNMSDEELADFLGVARPSLSRELMRMQADGLIEVTKKCIYIKDKDSIEMLYG